MKFLTALLLVGALLASCGTVAQQPLPTQAPMVESKFLPIIARAQAVDEPAVEVYDYNGHPVDWSWLVENFGAVEILPRKNPTEPGWRVAALFAHGGGQSDVPCVVDVTAIKDSVPVIGKRIAFYWPDAPIDEAAGGLGRCDSTTIRTDGAGSAGLSMGGGAKYPPLVDGLPSGGPHATWIYGENSEILNGWGWLTGTGHWHLDVLFFWDDGGMEEAKLDEILWRTRAIYDVLITPTP